MLNADELNNDIVDWEKNNHADLLQQMDALNIQHSKNSPNKTPLRQALKKRFFTSDDFINRIRYSFPRSAVFLHKGVSRSHPINHPRQAKEWFNPVVDKNIESLAELVADGQGNLIINNIDIH